MVEALDTIYVTKKQIIKYLKSKLFSFADKKYKKISNLNYKIHNLEDKLKIEQDKVDNLISSLNIKNNQSECSVDEYDGIENFTNHYYNLFNWLYNGLWDILRVLGGKYLPARPIRCMTTLFPIMGAR